MTRPSSTPRRRRRRGARRRRAGPRAGGGAAPGRRLAQAGRPGRGDGGARASSWCCSIAFGAKSIPFGDGVAGAGRQQRVDRPPDRPRAAGPPHPARPRASARPSGLAGALMQGVTRNPLADPGLLGVDAGAALAVVDRHPHVRRHVADRATSGSPSSGPGWPAWSSTCSGRVGRGGATPGEAGARRRRAHRAADVADLGGAAARRADARRVPVLGRRVARRPRQPTCVTQVAPFLARRRRCSPWRRPGRSTRSSLGDDVARSLGQRVHARPRGCRRCRSSCCAARPPRRPARSGSSGSPCRTWPAPSAGPTTAGSCRGRWCWRPTLLLSADVIGRVVARPGELQVGIVTAFLGAPFFIALVRRRKLADL